MAFYIFPSAVPKNDCKKYLEHCLDTADFENGATVKRTLNDTFNQNVFSSSNEITTDPVIRKTSVSFIDDESDVMNEIIWGFIRHANKKFFNYELRTFQPIQFAKYQNGGHYDWHQDDSVYRKKKLCRKLSLTFSLSDPDDYEGGELQFYNGGRKRVNKIETLHEQIKSVGTVIVFDSRDWHRVTPVTKGVRYSIVCWTVGPNFI
jgi:PKHD-type hydroxylase